MNNIEQTHSESASIPIPGHIPSRPGFTWVKLNLNLSIRYREDTNMTSAWHEVYKAAVLETDWTKMEERIQAAEAALHERKNEFDLNHGGTREENQAIEDASNGLNTLGKEVSAWLGSKQAS